LSPITLVLSTAGIGEAPVSALWRERGGSARGRRLGKTAPGRAAFDPAVAPDAPGLPVVVDSDPAADRPPETDRRPWRRQSRRAVRCAADPVVTAVAS